MLVIAIVSNTLADQINAAIDRALAGRPCDDGSRQVLFNQVLSYFDEHGRIPDFSLTPSRPTESTTT